MRLALIPSEHYRVIMDALIAREQKGKQEYGTTVDRTDISHEAWVGYGIEELLDALMYLGRAGYWEVIPEIYSTILTIIRLEAIKIYEKTGNSDLASANKMDG
jgi:hypothetical protein